MILVDVFVSGIRMMIASLRITLSSVKLYEQKHLSALLSFTYNACPVNLNVLAPSIIYSIENLTAQVISPTNGTVIMRCIDRCFVSRPSH